MDVKSIISILVILNMKSYEYTVSENLDTVALGRVCASFREGKRIALGFSRNGTSFHAFVDLRDRTIAELRRSENRLEPEIRTPFCKFLQSLPAALAQCDTEFTLELRGETQIRSTEDWSMTMLEMASIIFYPRVNGLMAISVRICNVLKKSHKPAQAYA